MNSFQIPGSGKKTGESRAATQCAARPSGQLSAKIAEYSGYSLAYFTKAFKKYMHDTPIMHLNKRRISDAKALLKDKNLQLMDIATAVGYKNLSTFTEAFKRCMGLLPSEYRNKYIQ